MATNPSPFIESVVLATDLSEGAELAFAHALAVAVLRRARLTLLHVTSDDEVDWSRFPAVRATLARWNLLEPGASQAAVFERLGVRVTKRAITSRHPGLAVAEHLRDMDADLLVVATEGREGTARWLHGSVAEAMARWSRTMTLFVPTDTQRSIVSVDGKLSFKNVLIPIDHAPDASDAIEFARRAAEIVGDGNVTITLLHIGAERDMPRVSAADGPAWTFSRIARDGDPVSEILACGENLRADLIVMATAGRHGVFEALQGSTTERVLRGARCPLLAVPEAR